MKVSIIIPNYNSEKTIRFCLDAIFRQDYEDYEVIIADDMSSDSCLEIAKEYKTEIVSTGKNGGPAIARNVGAKKASGKILFFVDSDVALEQNAVSIAVKEFEKDDKIAAVCGVYTKQPLIKDSLVEEYRCLQDYYWKKSTKGYITTLNVANGAIKKEIYLELEGFDESLRASEDVEFGNRISEKYKILSTPEIKGAHDCDDKLWKILRNFNKRARERVTLFVKRKKFNKGYATANRGIGSVLAGGSLALLIIGLNLNLTILYGALILFIGYLLSDPGIYLFVRKEKGLVFTGYFTIIHYMVNIAIFLGVSLGFFDKYMMRK